MTDRDTKLRAVAQRFLGWEPDTHTCGVEQCYVQDHQIPPPDPADPAVRVALENAIVTADLWLQIEGALRYGEDEGPDRTIWKVRIGLGAWHQADILADALLEAAYALVKDSPQP